MSRSHFAHPTRSARAVNGRGERNGKRVVSRKKSTTERVFPSFGRSEVPGQIFGSRSAQITRSDQLPERERERALKPDMIFKV